MVCGICARDNKRKVLEVSDKLVIYNACRGDLRTRDSCAVSLRSVRQRTSGASVAAAWTPPIGVHWEVHRSCHYSLLKYAETSVSGLELQCSLY